MGYSELDPLAAAFGVRHDGGPELVVTLEGVPVTVSLAFDSGRVIGLHVHLMTHPLPEVLMRGETERDVKGKAGGINREVQLGDEEFDRRVYIETDAPDETIKQLLARPEHRAAVRKLLWGGVCFSATGVTAGSFGSSMFDPDFFRKNAVEILAFRTLPRLSSIGASPDAHRGIGVVVAFCVLVPVMIGALLFALLGYMTRSWVPVLVGAAAGLLAWIASSVLLRLYIRGRATSYRRYLAAIIVSFFDLVGLGAATPVLVNALFDGAPPMKHETKILTVSQPADEDSCLPTTVAPWEPGGAPVRLCFGSGVGLAPGDRVVVETRPGFLGYEWGGTDAEAWSNTAGDEHGKKP